MYKHRKNYLLALVFPLMLFPIALFSMSKDIRKLDHKVDSHVVLSAKKINDHTIEILYADSRRMTIDFYGDHIFRLFQDPKGGILRDPEANPPADILVDNPRVKVGSLHVTDDAENMHILTDKIDISVEKSTGLIAVVNTETGKTVFQWTKPVSFENNKVSLFLTESKDEYFFGGGVQNGRFSHKGKSISIENQNSWTDGGVASPTPFYWSTNGYAMLAYTFKKGKYDFASTESGVVHISHEMDYLDVFFMINNGAVPLLNDFYQLTGKPILLPKFGFYQGHLNAYNRDYWIQDDKGIPFEDGQRYKESQKDNTGIKESLNGELANNYQFSARAVIDRYKAHDMPFGWILPNDGYGAGYGQTATLDSNINNLKTFGDYARRNGVEIGLWTQSDLHPKDSISALLQRDIVKEVRDAGVRVLKTDVAWVGPGYSFGLNGVADVAHIIPYYGNEARPFIISLDGWAGTQRYASIWTGDQTGGVWEYIRFHIPTYLGSGLSGQPNITSDVDGIFGGKNIAVNIRDFQWKTFTPMELNMDGWGSNPKYPHVLGDSATSINRNYLKLKSELIPYAYSIAKEAVDGLPMVRAMFLEYPNAYTLGTSTQYQFLYGPHFLVAPIYEETAINKAGDDVRNGIYLPDGNWIDYFSGEKYSGNRVINNYASPIWKLPVFVKEGAIIPMSNPNNNVSEIDSSLRIYDIYPAGQSHFTEYDDDGKTEAYKQGKGVTTKIESNVDSKHNVTVTVHPAEGAYDGFNKIKKTEFRINVTAKPKGIQAKVGKSTVKLREVTSREELVQHDNVFLYDEAPNFNKFSNKGSEIAKEVIRKNPQVVVKLAAADITAAQTTLLVRGFKFEPRDSHRISAGSLTAPAHVQVTEENTTAYTLKPTWKKVDHADFYEIEFNNLLYSTIRDTSLLFDGLQAETNYAFKIRSVNKDGYSDWSSVAQKTKSNPLEFAIQGIVGETSVQNQGSEGIDKLVDFDESSMWHTKWGTTAVPFDMVLDLKSINQLAKFHYLPRSGRGNGILLKGTVAYSHDKKVWTNAGSFTWANTDAVKIFEFKDPATARYVKLSITEAVGGFGSGRELYIFKVPGTESYIPGDINNDRLLDVNDLTSYTNYTGLRLGDSDFEGYISNGDINKNDLIDAYDISVLTTQLEGGVQVTKNEKVAGEIILQSDQANYVKDEMVEIRVSGKGLKAVNAMSFALPYSSQDYEYVGVTTVGTKQMENLTYDRLHTNGSKALYPTFVNLGTQERLTGDSDLFVIRLKAKRAIKFNLKAIDGFIVDPALNFSQF